MATYEEVKNIPKHPEVYLIEVRNPDELQQTGVIPGSLNIPLPNLEKALKMADADFKNAYKRDKPGKDAQIIFTCRSGARAQQAADQAKAVGYKNVKVYKGSWNEWAKKEGLPS